MKLKRYSHYKDSHIDWIGEIPENWNVRRLKINFQYKKGKIPKELFEEKIYDNYYPYLSMDFLRGKEDNALFTSKKYGGIKVNNNDLLLLWDGSNAGEFVIGKEGFLSSTMVKFDLFNIDINYSYYLTSSFESVLRDLTIGMGIPHVNGSDLNNIKIPFIPLQTQQRISSFLDSKTLQIENLIEKDKKLIELLKERRISLINKAVTKGLDDSVKMKDSFFGEIPFNSNIINIKYLSKSVVTGTTPTSSNLEYFKDELNWFTPGDFISQNLLDSKRKIAKIAILDNECKLFPKKSVLLVSIGATLGKVAYSEEKFSCNQQINAIIPNEKLHYKFLYYYLLVFQDLIKSFSLETTLAILNQDRLKLIPIIVHNIYEQQKIVEFLDKETERIDNHIKKVEKRIELLKEYKKSLIYNVVTGKVEV